MRNILSSTSFLVVNKYLASKIGIDASILLADLISKEGYFIDTNGLVDGYFFNTSENILKDTTLSKYKQRESVKILKDYKFIQTNLAGMPSKLYFRINHDKILKFLTTSSKKTKQQAVKKAEPNNNKLIKIQNNISIRDAKFKAKIISYKNDFSIELLEDFYMYWSEVGGTKMRFEKSKTFDIKRRLLRWQKNETKWNNKASTNNHIDSHNKAKDILNNL
tara:strand:- start:873 stop:1532 length:660 start_codon:yes stop_codon:yes gene_type:complete